jgi:phytoene dehydrogenase-like protein
MNQTYDVVVVGAGLAGLVAGALAAESAARVAVLDAHQPGGRAATIERDGFHLNEGAHALYRGGPGEAMLRRLNVPIHGHAPPTPLYGRVGDDVELLPVTPTTVARSRLLGVRSKARLAAAMQRVTKLDPAREAHRTASDWLDGLELPPDADGVTRSLARVATYSNALDHLSADAAIAQLQTAAKNGVLYLDGGWLRIVDALAARAVERGAELKTRSTVTAVQPAGDGYEILAGDDAFRARAVVIAVGSPTATARLLPFDPDWSTRLGPPSVVVCLDLGLAQPPPRPVVFGIDQPLYFSTHSPPSDLAPAGRALVSLLRYLAPGEEHSREEDREILDRHAEVAGVAREQIVLERLLHQMTVSTALPVPAAGGLAGRPGIEVAELPGVFVCGDWVGPTGMLSDASFASAGAAARAAATHAGALVAS